MNDGWSCGLGYVVHSRLEMGALNRNARVEGRSRMLVGLEWLVFEGLFAGMGIGFGEGRDVKVGKFAMVLGRRTVANYSIVGTVAARVANRSITVDDIWVGFDVVFVLVVVESGLDERSVAESMESLAGCVSVCCHLSNHIPSSRVQEVD